MNLDPDPRARRFLRYGLLLVLAVVAVPLVLSSRVRKLVGLAMLGILYSTFLVNRWNRWKRSLRSRRWPLVRHLLNRRFLGWVDALLPVRAWGVVPCVIEFVVLLFGFVFGWFLGPLFQEIIQNPSTMGWIRELLQDTSPEVFRFLNDLTFSPDPEQVLRENTQQIFTSLNNFFSAIVLPVTFFVFTGVGAALYGAIAQLLRRAEGSPRSDSRILDRYGRLFGEYLRFNTLYYLLLSLVIGAVLYVLDLRGLTDFRIKVITGLVVSFIGGNIIVPGLGTLILSVMVCAQLYLYQGWLGALVGAGVFVLYFASDDYLVKPLFLTWLGRQREKEWDFGVEVLILSFLILYSTFGLVGILLTFPGLCFLDAYLRQLHPTLRPWILRPLQTIQHET